MSALDLTNSRYRVEHAQRHLQEFGRALTAFNKTDPYVCVCEVSEDGTEDLYKAKLVQPMPMELPGIAFDIVSNLRSALDLAGYSSAIAAGKSDAEGVRIHADFPFRDLEAEFDGARKHSSRDIPKEIFDVMVSFKPYKGGNKFLWGLNKLTNIEKHRIVVPASVVSGPTHIKHLRVTGGSVLNEVTFGFLAWDPDKMETIWARMKRGGHLDANIRFRGFIALGNVEGLAGEHAYAAFKSFMTEVIKILDAIEAEAARIGLGV